MRTERRQAQRNRVYQGASIVFNGRQSVLGCTIRNWSESGAMVRMSDWMTLPPSFELDIASRGERLRVRECWRRGENVGLAFLAPNECRPAEPVSLAVVRERSAAKRQAG